jgi:hypothetical protein
MHVENNHCCALLITICPLAELRASLSFLCRNQGKILVFIFSFFKSSWFFSLKVERFSNFYCFVFCKACVSLHFQWLFCVLHIFMFHSNFCNSSFTMDTRDLIVALGSLKLYKVFEKKMIQAHHFFHQCWAMFFLLYLQGLFCTISN